MTEMRFAVICPAGETPELTAEALAKAAWESTRGAGHLALVDGIIMGANAGQSVDVILARWAADKSDRDRAGLAHATEVVPTGIVGGAHISQLEAHFSRVEQVIGRRDGCPKPVYSEWSNVAIWHNPGTDAGLVGVRLIEDEEAKSPWFDSRKA